MTDSSQDKQPEPTPAQEAVRLVEALIEMRDSFVHVSLALHDYQFVLESELRERAADMAGSLISEIRTR